MDLEAVKQALRLCFAGIAERVYFHDAGDQLQIAARAKGMSDKRLFACFQAAADRLVRDGLVDPAHCAVVWHGATRICPFGFTSIGDL